MENFKSYYAILPANVRYDDKIPANAKLLYGEITALCNEKGYCWATNNYFSNLYKVSPTSISKWISSLEKEGYIKRDIIYKSGTKEILNRYLRIVNTPIEEKLNTPIEEKLKENNTLINNTINNKLYSNDTQKKYKYGEFKHVSLTTQELERLNFEYGVEETQKAIKHLDEYMEMNGKKYQNCNLALRKWVYDAIKVKKRQEVNTNGCTTSNADGLVQEALKAGIGTEFGGFGKM